MPDWAPPALAIAVVALVVAGRVVATAVHRGGHGQAPMPGPDGDRTGAPADSAVYAPCDWVDCGAHRSTPHDITADGLTCRECGRGPQ